MTEQGVIVIIGSPTALLDMSGVHQAGGLPIRVAAELVRRGERVELVGRVGADAAGDQAILSLSRDGIGHVALLRDPALVTPAGDAAHGIPVDAGDVQLGLRYLTSFTTVLLIDPLDASVVRQVTEDASFVGAQLIIVAKSPLPAESSAASAVLGGGSPPPLFIPRPQVEGPEFDALLVGLAATERGAEAGV
jgi:hypothetical protein